MGHCALYDCRTRFSRLGGEEVEEEDFGGTFGVGVFRNATLVDEHDGRPKGVDYGNLWSELVPLLSTPPVLLVGP